MFAQQTLIYSAILASLAVRQVAAHGFCVKFGVGDKTYAGFDPTWAEGPSILGHTPQRPTDNVNTEWADYKTEQVATGGYKTSEVGTPQDTVPAKAGDKITIWYDQWPQPHSGPYMRYMAKCPGSCDGVPAGDLDWFKIGQEGYHDGQWPNDRLLASNQWAMTFTLPTNLPGGNYLLANHMLALHNVGQPQFYPVAFQIALESDGTVDPQPKGKFPDIYLSGPQDFATWNIYEQGVNNAKMQLPGIAVYAGSNAKMGDTGSNGAQGGVGGGKETPPKAPTSSEKKSATTSSRGKATTTVTATPAPSASKTTSEAEEGKMTIWLASEGDGPTVTTPPIMETDMPTIEPEDQEDQGHSVQTPIADDTAATKTGRRHGATKTKATAGAQPTNEPHMCDEADTTVNPIANTNSHHVEPADEEETDEMTEEAPVEAIIPRPSKAPSGQPNLSTATVSGQPSKSSVVEGTLEPSAGPTTVTVTVYALAPTTGTGDSDVTETPVGQNQGQGRVGASATHASHVKEGQASPTNPADEGEEVEDEVEDTEGIEGGGDSGVPTQKEDLSQQQQEAPAGDIPDDCLHELNLDTGVYERDLRRSRMRRRSGFRTNLRR